MPPRDDDAAYVFDGFRLDPVQGMLFDPEGREVRLRPKPFALLRHLLDHPGRLFGREELLDALWPGVVVTDDALTQSISDLRRAFGAHAAAILRTVPRRGYMLAATVTRHAAAPPAPQPSPAAAPEPAPRTPTLPIAMQRRETIVVLPVGAPTGDAMALRLAPVFGADLLTELVRFEDLRVVAGPDSSVVAGYVVHTHVHIVDAVARASVRVEDIVTGTALWADRIEWSLKAGAAPVATVALLAGALDLQIGRKSLRRAEQKPPEKRTARECTLVGRSLHERGTEQETEAARAQFIQAAARDPGYAPAYAWHAFTLMRIMTHAWAGSEGEGQTREAVRLARLAVQHDPQSALCQSALAFALAIDAHWDEAIDTARLALRYTRTADFGTRTACAEVLAASGLPEAAVAALQESLALDPRCPPRSRAVLGRALLLAGRPEDALRELRLCAAQLPDYAPAHRSTVVAAIEAGLFDEARAALHMVRRLRPPWVPGRQPIFWLLRRPQDIARFENAFAMAQRLDVVAASGGLMKPTTTRS